jgi:hypothetical protein
MLSIHESYNLSKCNLVSLKSCLTPKLGWKKNVRDLWTVHFGLKTQNEQSYILFASGANSTRAVEFDTAILKAYGYKPSILPRLYELLIETIENRVELKNR